MTFSRCVLCIGLLAVTANAGAELLDSEGAGHPLLESLGTSLEAVGIDTAFNLNGTEVVETELQRPRMGALADLPSLRFPLTSELVAWEEAFSTADIGALAFLPAVRLSVASSAVSHEEFYEAWLNTDSEERFFLSFHAEDMHFAEAIKSVLADGHAVMPLAAVPEPDGLAEVESAGRLYATAGQRWVIDSLPARDYDSDIAEFLYVGEALRRDSDSVIDSDSRALRRIASGEPAVFLKETLGDEFEASTIPEIIVPGGIAFGENAVFTNTFSELVFENEQLWLEDVDGKRFLLPREDVTTWKATFDFAARSAAIASDAIVDIDERGRVKISSALRDTDVGAHMVRIDTEPFNYVQRLDVRKSVIVDTAIHFRGQEGAVQFETDYEVRYLRSDRAQIARTQAALVYKYLSATEDVSFQDSWGPDAFRLEGRTDFEGLGESTAQGARYAAWIALFRGVLDNSLDFSHGRYEFMKNNKAGRATPSRI